MGNKDFVEQRTEKDKKRNELKNIANVLNQPKFRHPHSAANGQCYRDDLKNRLDEYMKVIDGILKIDDSIISEEVAKIKIHLKPICEHLLAAVNAYLSGHYGHAYEQIDTLFKNGNRHLLQKLVSEQPFSHKQYLYRVRPSNHYLHDLGDLFHIPFNLRHLVSGQRYSIPGVPSLYLGASLYVCWQEMGYPDLNSLYISSFALRHDTHEASSINLLNLAFSVSDLSSGLELTGEKFNEIIAARIILYPLVMASSYTRANDNASFHEEYIIPSLLLQWVNMNKHVAGISYFSTKRNLELYDPKLINYVFPTKAEGDTPASKGFSNALIKTFQFTPPIAWQFLDAQDLVQKGHPVNDRSFDHFSLGFQKGRATNFSTAAFFRFYEQTSFGRQEAKLANMAFSTLEQPHTSD